MYYVTAQTIFFVERMDQNNTGISRRKIVVAVVAVVALVAAAVGGVVTVSSTNSRALFLK